MFFSFEFCLGLLFIFVIWLLNFKDFPDVNSWTSDDPEEIGSISEKMKIAKCKAISFRCLYTRFFEDDLSIKRD